MRTGSIAAGVQAGIGSVAAGSVFATLTSAAMAGYGVPIVFGGVWAISSAIGWGIAAWKRNKRDSDSPDGPGEDGDRFDGIGAGAGDGGGGGGDAGGVHCAVTLSGTKSRAQGRVLLHA